MTGLPAPEQWVIKNMSLEECAEMIKRHIDFVDKDGRSVHPPTSFVRHYMRRNDGRLPTVVAVSTLPPVFADGGVWSEDKFDRLRGTDFRIQPEVANCVPKPGTVTDDDVREAMVLNGGYAAWPRGDVAALRGGCAIPHDHPRGRHD